MILSCKYNTTQCGRSVRRRKLELADIFVENGGRLQATFAEAKRRARLMHKSSSGAVYSLKLHLVIVTKYRYKVINQELHQRLLEIFSDTCTKWECECLELNTEKDHLHALLDVNPKVAPCKLVNSLKTVSSRLIRKEFSEYLSGFYKKPVLWSIGYAVNSCGGATLEKVKEYIKNQDTAAE